MEIEKIKLAQNVVPKYMLQALVPALIQTDDLLVVIPPEILESTYVCRTA